MKNKLKLVTFGAFAGLCNGLFGSGGGMVVVPCLEKYARLDEQKSHATAILVILPLSVISLFKYSSGMDIDIKKIIVIVLGGVLGSFAGALWLKKLSGTALKRIFGVFILAAAVRMVIA